MTEERATMNAIEDTRQLFNARLETLEAKIDGKLALIFQRLDAMPDRAEMHKAISDAVSETTRATNDLRKLIVWGSVAACASILSLSVRRARHEYRRPRRRFRCRANHCGTR